MKLDRKKYPVLADTLAPDWQDKDKVIAEMKPGDIVEVKDKYGIGYFVIIPEEDGSGFHYYASDANGELKTERKKGIVNHSNMYFKEPMRIVGNRPLKKHEYKGVSWYTTGYEAVDSELANLDGRYQLFRQLASPEMKALYEKQESQNFHMENQQMVEEFADHLARGGSPDKFSPATH